MSTLSEIWANTGEWKFLDEPIWRWTVFLIAIGLILGGWSGIVRGLKRGT